MNTKDIIMAVLGTISMGLVYLIKRYGDKFKEMADKTDTKVDNTVLYIANLVVPFIENTFNGSTGEEKKKNAMLKVAGELAKIGINTTNDKISEAIETAVVKMKGDNVAKEEKKQEVEN